MPQWNNVGENGMSKRLMAGVAVAALMAVSAPAVNAAEQPRNTANQQGVTATNPAGSDQILPTQMRASKVIGAKVYDRQNQKLGTVQDLVLDKDGRVAAVVVSVGSVVGVGGKNVAVRMSDIKTDNNRLTLDKTKQQLDQAANYQLTDRDTGAGKGPSPVTGGHVGSGTSTPKQ
jgi:sporulation protein YlmC with PRC-barrel domain